MTASIHPYPRIDDVNTLVSQNIKLSHEIPGGGPLEDYWALIQISYDC